MIAPLDPGRVVGNVYSLVLVLSWLEARQLADGPQLARYR